MTEYILKGQAKCNTDNSSYTYDIEELLYTSRMGKP
jgi:hypothetical protein